MTECVHRRIKPGVLATVRYRIRSKMEMHVLDLSEGGCLLESRGWSVKPGERVLVRLPGLGEIGATIIWMEDRRAGLAFEEAVYGPVLESFFE